MKKFRKILAVLLALLLAVGCMTIAFAATDDAAQQPDDSGSTKEGSGDCALCGRDHGENKARWGLHYLWWLLTYTISYFFIH